MAQALKEIGEHLQAIEQHSALRMTLQQHSQAGAQGARRRDRYCAPAGLAIKWLVWTATLALAFGLLSAPVLRAAPTLWA